MNIYCLIFMCTFAGNSTDTEIPLNGSLIENNTSLVDKTRNEVDVAKMILPEKGAPVPQFGDIVMELPTSNEDPTTLKNSQGRKSFPSISITERASPQQTNSQNFATEITDSSLSSVTLSDILLPPGPFVVPEKTKK